MTSVESSRRSDVNVKQFLAPSTVVVLVEHLKACGLQEVEHMLCVGEEASGVLPPEVGRHPVEFDTYLRDPPRHVGVGEDIAERSVLSPLPVKLEVVQVGVIEFTHE
eukprot:CAMPEP_0175881250 /NCGR_PEP_ID=MMETSP0107_2-20121207/42771_1 /TAXON_ID=195067 ORGANISM="Goniomonas pacifica, Strain CCMP1869" /NCGR_SAMPLE_ID=MMETSP0107_2 /ASSEMBLY_ACC=CAM_ASM_000203 /LENGTH=106 /DNA_ID=CAMNT_0017201089 /DNA_START=112 /DNA_END=432 /DNA_ORIENTATION=-